MMVFAWILWLAASAHTELANEICQIPAGDYRYVEVELNQDPSRISASYEVQSGSGRVRLVLMRRDDLERLRDDLPHGLIAVTSTGRSGNFVDSFDRTGAYAVVLDNRDSAKPATVHLRVWLDANRGRGPEITHLSPQRQATVVTISFAVFFAIVGFSGRRLWRGVKGKC